MRSTFKDKFRGAVPPYIGADLTDRYSRGCRPIDVCGLTPDDNGQLKASFWTWEWDAAPNMLDVTAIVKELAATRAAMLDGPQGLAAAGHTLRDCERKSAAVGQTPDTRPQNRPFAGFICSSLDLFAELENSGVKIGQPNFLKGVSEVYPGHIWRILANGIIPNKYSNEGRQARRQILKALGVEGLPEAPTHDQNDACVAAVMAAAEDKKVSGITLKGIGKPLTVDPDGTLREGVMVVPNVSADTLAYVSNSINGIKTIRATAPNADEIFTADQLLDYFIDKAVDGRPTVCTYSWAYRHLFNRQYDRWFNYYATQVVKVARQSTTGQLPGLGAVRLDTFIVAKRNRIPSKGHWITAAYTCEAWKRVLGNATVLHTD